MECCCLCSCAATGLFGTVDPLHNSAINMTKRTLPMLFIILPYLIPVVTSANRFLKTGMTFLQCPQTLVFLGGESAHSNVPFEYALLQTDLLPKKRCHAPELTLRHSIDRGPIVFPPIFREGRLLRCPKTVLRLTSIQTYLRPHVDALCKRHGNLQSCHQIVFCQQLSLFLR